MLNGFRSFSRDQLSELFALCGFSDKQTAWLIEVLPRAATTFEAAIALVIAEKGGAEMGPFETSDDELADEAQKLLQTGFLAAWNHEVGVRQ